MKQIIGRVSLTDRQRKKIQQEVKALAERKDLAWAELLAAEDEAAKKALAYKNLVHEECDAINRLNGAILK